MKYLLYLFLFLYITLIILSQIYKNPFKLFYIFGKKGSGKTMYEVSEMIKYQKHGWHIYSDIPDLNLYGARKINAKDLEHFTLKHNSALFLDEIGLTWDNRKFKSFPDGVNEWFKFQRKYKCVVYVNSQQWDADLKIRSLVDKYFLVQDIANVITVVRPIKRTVTVTQATSEAESRIADQLEFEKFIHWKFLYKPHYFKYFDSYSAPERPIIPSEIITDGIKVVKGKNLKKIMKEINKENRFNQIHEL